MTLGLKPALKNLLKRLDAEENVALWRYSTLKVGGPADYFVTTTNIKDLKTLQKACSEHNVSLHVLSGGSNTLFSDDGFRGVVVRLGAAFDFIEPNRKSEGLVAGAATSLAKVSKLAISMGWAPAVGFLGIPGLIGGAIRMNAGTKAGEMKDAIESVYGILDGYEAVFLKNDLQFFYRGSSLPKNLIVWQAAFSIERHLYQPTNELLRSASEYRRKRKLTQPAEFSLGSFFKNPYPAFAAQLIENCNLKGLAHKGAQISPLHANFIINNGSALASDILYIAKLAQRTVFDKSGICLTPEVRFVGTFPPGLTF